jgi:hypothetical protein
MHTERGMIRPVPIPITRMLAPGGEGRRGMRMAAALMGGLVSLVMLPAEAAPRRTIGVPTIDVERTAPRPPNMPERRPPLPRPRPTALAQAMSPADVNWQF